MRKFAAVLAVAFATQGCPKTFYPGNPPCETDEDCTPAVLGSEFVDFICVGRIEIPVGSGEYKEDVCVPSYDVIIEDAGPIVEDATPFVDAAVIVDAAPDAGFPEAGPEDIGSVDSGPFDAGLPPENLAGGTPCTDTVDNDRDGLVDCDDPDCAPLPFCTDEICDNEWDDNANGLTDCDDPACVDVTACLDRVTICDLHEAGYFNECATCHQDRFDNQGNRISTASGNFRVDPSSPQSLFDSMRTPGSQNRTSFVSGNAAQSFVYAKIAGTQTQVEPACADNDTECIQSRGGRMPLNLAPLSNQAVGEIARWLDKGDIQRCLQGFPVEDCSDGEDNDGDGRTDCDDRDCRSHILCGEAQTICDIQREGVFLPCINCHQTQNQGGLRITVTSPQALYDSLVGVNSVAGLPLIQHRDHLGSYVYLKVTGQHLNVQGGAGVAMPQVGDPLPQNHLDMLRSWISNSESLDACLNP